MSSHMGRFELLVLCSLLFATVNSSVLQREKREKGSVFFKLCMLNQEMFSTFEEQNIAKEESLR